MADKNTSLPKNASAELGASGTIIQHGIITNSEYNKNLTGQRGIKIFEIMRRSDSTVRSALQIVKLPILSAVFDIEAAKNELADKVEDDDEFKARFVKRELMQRNINFKRHIKKALSQFDYGFSAFEIVLELTEFESKLMIGIQKLAPRKQSSIMSWETEDGEEGVTQMVNGKTYSIPRVKMIIYTHDQDDDDDPQGTSLLRYVYKDWDLKDKLTLVNAIALEKQGVGVPIVKEKEGANATPTDEAAAVEAVSNIRANEKSFMKIPNTMEVEMLDMKGSTTKEVLPTLNYHDGRIMAGVLARFMELGGASGTGAQALSGDLSSVFMKAEEAVADEIVSTLTEDLIKKLCDLNFSEMPNGYPKLTYGSISDDDVAGLATSLNSLVTAGVIVPDDDLEDNVRGRLHLPAAAREEGAEPAQRVVKKTEEAVTEKEKETAKLKQEDDVEASLEEAREYRAKLIASVHGA